MGFGDAVGAWGEGPATGGIPAMPDKLLVLAAGQAPGALLLE